MRGTIWIDAVRCDRCGDITAAEFSGPPEVASYQPLFPVLCSLDLVREELRHPQCGGRIALAQLDNVYVSVLPPR